MPVVNLKAMHKILQPASSNLESLKWLALLLMTVDHVDLVLLDRTSETMFRMGRAVLPLFAFALASGLARAESDAVYYRVLRRLLIAGIAAQLVITVCLQLPVLNVLFTLGAGVCGWLAITRTVSPLPARATLFVAAALIAWFAEFGLIGFAVMISACWAAGERNLAGTSVFVLSVALLELVNGNSFALLSLVIIALAEVLPGLPRLRGFFYWYYPVHLLLLWVVMLTLESLQ